MPFEAHGISDLIARLGRVEIELQAELEGAALESGGIIADQAKSNADFSSTIPAQISVSAKFSGANPGAQVRVAEGVYPHVREAAVLEGDGDSPSTFRHPVYDHGGWAEQMSHPFLHPALDEKHDEAVAPIAAAVRRVITGG
jgi:HK97 gp10 family phage protein